MKPNSGFIHSGPKFYDLRLIAITSNYNLIGMSWTDNN